MTRRAVQIALFASAAWLVSWPAAIVWSMVVRDVESPPWVVVLWLLLMTGSGILIVAGLLWLVIADTVRGRPTPPVDEEEEMVLEEPAELDETAELAGELPAEPPAQAPGADTVGIGAVRVIPPEGTRDFPSSSVPGESALLRSRQPT